MSAGGFKISATVKDDAIRAALKRADKNTRKDARNAIKRAVDETLLPRARAGVPSVSGRYQRSIRSGATARVAYVQARTPYAKVNERGRAPMLIRPLERGGSLSTPFGPRRVVRSPRYPARHMLSKAVTPGVPAAARRVETYMTQALRSYL